ncbi:hypothetical protein SLS58_000086 [Diplodia intermedia]|uniref:S-adenosyl-L-methionine-dependent methyltransferase n=1 Tax=Diplodia intermedia TaxID=856260 RepID=A0ABR3U4R6_9PEZI
MSSPAPPQHPPAGQPAAAGPAPDLVIEADSHSETDSALGDDAESYTTSLRSSIFNYTFENGRRYHAYGEKYFLPNDEAEMDRLDLFHHILTLRCGGELHLAPIAENPQRILDIGTGTGIWAIEMADEYPSADVLGTDLSPIQPAMLPPNCKFEIDDCEQDWLYSTKFDYIHARYLAGTIKDWPRLVQQAYRFLKPGGWIELQDFTMKFYTTNGEFKPGCPLDKWCDGVIEGVKAWGREPEPGPLLEGWVKDAGFTNITHKLLPLPVGTWPKDRKMKEIGALDLVQFKESLESAAMRVFTAQGWQPEEVQVFLADVRKDLSNPKLQAQHNFHVVYAQKPLDAQ